MLQIDGRGYIKGTNQLYQEDVVVLQRFSYQGRPVLPGEIIKQMTGATLIDCKQRGLVRSFDPEKDAPEKTETKSKKSKKKKE